MGRSANVNASVGSISSLVSREMSCSLNLPAVITCVPPTVLTANDVAPLASWCLSANRSFTKAVSDPLSTKANALTIPIGVTTPTATTPKRTGLLADCEVEQITLGLVLASDMVTLA
nr:unnamed protein product [Fasciola hepatica]